MPRAKKSRLHCWHFGPPMWSYGTGSGGSTTAHCCHCGESRTVGWHTEQRPVKGHGEHHTESATVYDALPAVCAA